MKIKGSKKPQPGTSQLKPPVDKEAGSRVVLFMRLVAMNIEAREALAYHAERRMKLEAQLADPKLANHPKRPQAERRLAQRQEAERDAAMRVSETNTSLVQQWNHLRADDRNRYGLTKILRADPEQEIGLHLWSDRCGLAWLAPFPDGWVVPTTIAHEVIDFSRETAPAIYTREEILNSPVAPF